MIDGYEALYVEMTARPVPIPVPIPEPAAAAMSAMWPARGGMAGIKPATAARLG